MLLTYAEELRALLGRQLVGVYVYGSYALGAYRPGLSDVDVTTVHRAELTAPQRQLLSDLHDQLARRHPAAAALDANYAPLHLLGTPGDAALPYCRDGRFRDRGGGDVNPVMWRTLRGRGLVVCGPAAAEIVPPVSRAELVESMRRNLVFLSGRMPRYIVGGTETQVFGVLSLCRTLYTLRTGEIASKLDAAEWSLSQVHPRWRPIIERARARYESGDLRGQDWLLATQALAFTSYVRTLEHA
jgi:hypothetical protein